MVERLLAPVVEKTDLAPGMVVAHRQLVPAPVIERQVLAVVALVGQASLSGADIPAPGPVGVEVGPAACFWVARLKSSQSFWARRIMRLAEGAVVRTQNCTEKSPARRP